MKKNNFVNIKLNISYKINEWIGYYSFLRCLNKLVLDGFLIYFLSGYGFKIVLDRDMVLIKYLVLF